MHFYQVTTPITRIACFGFISCVLDTVTSAGQNGSHVDPGELKRGMMIKVPRNSQGLVANIIRLKNMSGLFNALPRPQRKPLRILTDLPLFFLDSPSYSSSPSGISSSVTTPSISSAQHLCHVICMHDFDSSDPVHLPFHRDEVLTIVKQEHSGWWAAMRPQGDRIGWIPSSFVMPLDRRKIVGYSEESLVPPLSAVHNPWVPVSDEDNMVFAFQLVTPTDLVPHQGFFDDKGRCHNDESYLNLSNRYHKPSSDMVDMGVPLAPESPSSHRIQELLLSEPGVSELTQTASSPLRDTPSFFHPHTYVVGD